MLVTTKIGIELQRPFFPAVINAVQGDQNTRQLEISFYSGSVAWQIPENITVAMRYCKPDKTKGYYDTMPDGAPAFAVSGNMVSILLAPQILTVPGTVLAQVVLMQGAEILSTFGIQIHVEADPSAGVMESEDYINWLQWIKTELDAYLERLKVNGEFVGGTVVGDVNMLSDFHMNGNVLDGLPYPAEDNQPATKGFTDETYFKNTGGDLNGPVRMNGNPISGLHAPTEDDQAANMGFVNDRVNQMSRKAAPWNLLDNSNFRNPVNQRNKKSYSGEGYGFDRWTSKNSENVIEFFDEGYIYFSHSCIQIVPAEKFRLGKKYTAVVCMHDGSVHLGSGNYGENFGNLGHVWVEYTADTGNCRFILQEPGNVNWAALYEGEYTKDTLPEYQPKEYSAELMECKRYFFMLPAWSDAGSGNVSSAGTYAGISVAVGIAMRGVVHVSGGMGGAKMYFNGKELDCSSSEIFSATARGAWLHLQIAFEETVGDYNHVATFKIGSSPMLFSAEL